jgi:Raf kinase inhibitor-like YbhB/YbcL family protein
LTESDRGLKLAAEMICRQIIRVGAGGIALAVGTLSPLAAGPAGSIKTTSSAFAQGGNIPARFTCDGNNTNPPLQFADIPAGAKALALVVDDPDAPGGLFTHWLVWNIDPKTTGFADGAAPKGKQGTNDFGNAGYGGPCPPSGTHRYVFKIFALDRELDLPAGAKRHQLEAAMRGRILAQGELMGRYTKQK